MLRFGLVAALFLPVCSMVAAPPTVEGGVGWCAMAKEVWPQLLEFEKARKSDAELSQWVESHTRLSLGGARNNKKAKLFELVDSIPKLPAQVEGSDAVGINWVYVDGFMRYSSLWRKLRLDARSLHTPGVTIHILFTFEGTDLSDFVVWSETQRD